MSDQDLDALNRAVTSAIWKAEREPSSEAWEEVARCEQALVDALPDGEERRIAARGVEEATRKAAELRMPDPAVAGGGVDGTTGLPLTTPLQKAEDREESFGNRLRLYLLSTTAVSSGISPDVREDLAALAAAVRQQIEKAVERGRYTTGTAIKLDAAPKKDVLDAEPFLEAIGAVFGERAETQPDVKAVAGAASDFLAAYSQHGAQPGKLAAELEALKRALR